MQSLLGVAIGATILNGGIQSIESGGVASGTEVDNGATTNVEPGGIARFIVVNSGGAEYVFSGGVANGTAVNNGGTETVAIFGVVSATVVNTGGAEVVRFGGTASDTVLLDTARQYAYSGAAVNGTEVSSGGTEVVSTGATAAGTVIDAGGAIDLPGLIYSSGGSASFDAGTNILTVIEGGNQYQQTLAGTYTNVSFRLAPDVGVGTLVTMDSTAPCFVTGTRIATDHGEVAVEILKIGDRVRLVDGQIAPIVWIGHRKVDCSRHPKPGLVWPVRVAEGAFGPGEPHRDLFLSPDHAVFVENVLVPVKYLINGTSVAQVKVAEVMYHHVELAVHDMLIAEGLPAESYLDTGDRRNFGNGGGEVVLHPNFSTHVREGMSCAKLVVAGREIEGVRRRLRERAIVVCPKMRRTDAA
jgi:antigen 43